MVQRVIGACERFRPVVVRFFLLMGWGFPLGLQAEPLQLARALAVGEARDGNLDSRVSSLPILKSGSRGHAVIRFNQWLLGRQEPDDVFDTIEEERVKQLQAQWGLKTDGIAGPILYANLTVPREQVNQRALQWAVRLEKLAHEARNEGFDRMVVVNVPSFTLRAIDLKTGETRIESSVIVGRPERPTPLGRMHITGIRYNPGWSPPPVIIKNDIRPRLGKDRAWFDKHGLRALGPDGESKPASDLSIEELDSGWRLYQPSGDGNALGRLKFETDSRDNIYLHDTNDPKLFGSALRTKSSGCIRVQGYLSLAAFLSESSEGEVRKRIEAKSQTGTRINRVPVFIEYSLVDVHDGRLVSYPDIYSSGNKKAAR